MINIYRLFTIVVFLTYAQPCLAQTPYTPWMDQQTKTDQLIEPPQKPISAENNKYTASPSTETESPLAQPSALEKMYSEQASEELLQFGYDMFASHNTSKINNNMQPMGAIQDSFILNAGDELLISFKGQRNDQDNYTISSNGQLLIPDFPIISAMGRSIAQITQEVRDHAQSMLNTKAYVSLSSVRQINLLVVGHVKNPGRKSLTVFNSILDALGLAGGIEKNGSLREIKLVRNGRSTVIDLYSLLMHGAPNTDTQLRDGDRLIVPPIGPTTAIAGAVKRPGIYELKKQIVGIERNQKNTNKKLTLNQMLAFSGGILSTGDNRFLKLESDHRGQKHVENVAHTHRAIFGDGTILSVVRGKDKTLDEIELIGHTKAPGSYDIATHKTLSSLLLKKNALDEDTYPLIGLIKRWNKKQLTYDIMEYPIRLVLNKKYDMDLENNDKIILLSYQDISDIYKKRDPKEERTNKEDNDAHSLTNEILDDEAIKIYLRERSVHVRGAIHKPGSYPISTGITLENILSVVGGMTLEGNKENIELTSNKADDRTDNNRSLLSHRSIINLNEIPANFIKLSPGDAVRINPKLNKINEETVIIMGEVLHAGEYDLLPGDKVSDLLSRAGGLSEQAYPAGAIFSRESERKIEEAQFQANAQNMEQRLAAAVQRDKNPPSADQIELVRALAHDLRTTKTLGRITVELNPAQLELNPQLDMYLEKGDRVYIPKRPLTVRVSGEILSPANLQFREKKSPRDYIQEAGGFTYHADKDRSFVLYPDGSAEPLRVNTWNHTPIFIPPGSTIIIPRDPKPFDFIESAKEVGQILSNLAVTSVFIDDIRD